MQHCTERNVLGETGWMSRYKKNYKSGKKETILIKPQMAHGEVHAWPLGGTKVTKVFNICIVKKDLGFQRIGGRPLCVLLGCFFTSFGKESVHLFLRRILLHISIVSLVSLVL